MIQTKRTSSGFALLITLLVLSVVIAVTLSILELSLKQLNLSVNSYDSEIAFHAANAGLECATRSRRLATTSIERAIPTSFTMRCFGTTKNMTPDTDDINIQSGSGNGTVVRYKNDIQWDSGIGVRCSEIDIIAVVASSGPITIGGSGSYSLKEIIPNYGSNTKVCQRGSKCTIVAVAGYSAPCNQKTNISTLKREILLEF